MCWMIKGLRDQDQIAGNGGRDIIEYLVQFCSHSYPEEPFRNMEEYLKFRCEDGGLP
jgi:hypothetical protein